jgi:RNA polymerase sigma-70 factor (ECF subfamily)
VSRDWNLGEEQRVSVDPGFREFYQKEFTAVFRAVIMLAGDRQLAEDATQEAFARALSRWRRLRTHPSPGGWVTTTALNITRRQLRGRPPIGTPQTTDVSGDIEGRVALRAAIGDLPARQQEAVLLHYLLDLPVSETASVMGIDQGTVKTHLSRARTALERALRDDEPKESSI